MAKDATTGDKLLYGSLIGAPIAALDQLGVWDWLSGKDAANSQTQSLKDLQTQISTMLDSMQTKALAANEAWLPQVQTALSNAGLDAKKFLTDYTTSALSSLSDSGKQAMAQLAPYSSMGKAALDFLQSDMLGKEGSPLYDWQQKTQSAALDKQLAARHMLGGGAAIGAQTQLTSQLTAQEAARRQGIAEYLATGGQQASTSGANILNQQGQAAAGVQQQAGNLLSRNAMDTGTAYSNALQTQGTNQANILTGFGTQQANVASNLGQGQIASQYQADTATQNLLNGIPKAVLQAYLAGKTPAATQG